MKENLYLFLDILHNFFPLLCTSVQAPEAADMLELASVNLNPRQVPFWDMLLSSLRALMSMFSSKFGHDIPCVVFAGDGCWETALCTFFCDGL